MGSCATKHRLAHLPKLVSSIAERVVELTISSGNLPEKHRMRRDL
jgi:hypothetical protein